MAETKTGIVMEFESKRALPRRYREGNSARYPKPGLSRQVFMSLLLCFPLTSMLWAAIVYGVARLVR
jgi:hypothetical protein